MAAIRSSTAVAVLVLLAMAATTVSGAKRAKANYKYSDADADAITTISFEQFREKIMDPTVPVALQFFDPTQKATEDFAPEVVKAARALNGHATFYAMDGTSNEGKEIMQMFQVEKAGLPALTLFNPEMFEVSGGQEGSYMKLPAVFEGRRQAKVMTRWVLEMIAGHDIDRLDDLVDFKEFTTKYQQLDMPKVVFVTSGNVTSPLFRTVSHTYRYGAQFAVVHNANLAEAAAAATGAEDATLRGELLAHLGLGAKPNRDGLPVVALITGAQSSEIELIREAGDPSFGLEKLTAAVGKVAWPAERRREMMMWFLDDNKKRRKREAEEAKMNKALPPVTAFDAQTWSDHCVNRKKGFCAAVFVEDPEDEAKLEWLQSASRKMAQRVSSAPSRLVVVGAYQQPELAQFFGAADAGFPTVVFINPVRKQYFNLIGSFSERGVVNFFADRVAKGKGRAYDPKKVPAFAEAKPAEEEDSGAAEDAGDEEIHGDL